MKRNISPAWLLLAALLGAGFTYVSDLIYTPEIRFVEANQLPGGACYRGAVRYSYLDDDLCLCTVQPDRTLAWVRVSDRSLCRAPQPGVRQGTR